MSLLLIALAIIIIGGLLALVVCKNSLLSTIFGVGSTVIGCIVGLDTCSTDNLLRKNNNNSSGLGNALRVFFPQA